MSGARPSRTRRERPRIVINGRFLGARQTGVQRVAHNLISALDAQPSGEIADAGAEVLTPRGTHVPMPLVRMSRREVGILRGVPWEQIELPGHLHGRSLVNLCNAAPLNVDSALTMIHDAQVFITPASYASAFVSWYRFALPRIARRACTVATVSEFSRAQLLAHGVVDEFNSVVLYNGADHVLKLPSAPGALRALGIGSRPYVVLFGNGQPHKNAEVVLRAFASGRLDDLQLVVVGPLTVESARKLCGGASLDTVTFLGRIGDDVLRAVLEGAVLLAFPSLTEGFGLPPLEAMTLGCPTVVAPAGALPEVCADAALYADPHAPDDWIGQIRRVAEDSDLRGALVEAGRRNARRFRWSETARRLSELVA